MKRTTKILFLFLITIICMNCVNSNKKIENFKSHRKGYILTCDEKSKRSIFSKNVLEMIGFEPIFFKCIKNEDKVLSNKNSMRAIYEIIANGNDDWVYIFEDDINIIENIDLQEIIRYEDISKMFFYLGTCGYDNPHKLYNSKEINGKKVAKVKGPVRGLHAIALSKEGAKKLLYFSNETTEIYMDVILEKFAQLYEPNIVRYDLESYIKGHRGIFFQDRDKFPTTI